MRAILVPLFSSFATLLVAALAAPAQMLEWREVAPMNAARSEMRAVVIDGRIYVAGGFNAAGQQLNSVEAYDTAANTWTLRAPAPRGMDHHMMAAHGGKLYVLKYDSIYVYDPAANAWSSRSGAGMLARGDGTAVTLGDHIYVIGGGPLPIQRYAPATGQWQTRASLRTARGHVNATVADGKIWILAGRSSSEAFRTVEVYDPVADTVTEGPSMDSARSGHAAETVNGRIFVSGGESPGNPAWRLTPTTEILNPSVGQWTFIESPPLAVHGHGSASLGGSFYVIGGATVAASSTNTNRVFRLNLAGGGTGLNPPGIPGKGVQGEPEPSQARIREGKVVFEAEKGIFQADGRTLPLASPAARD